MRFKLFFTFILGFILSFAANAQSFYQDFSGSSIVSDYVSGNTINKFTTIGVTNKNGGSVTIIDNKLSLSRTGNSAIYFAKSSPLNTLEPSKLIVSFEIKVEGNNAATLPNRSAGYFMIGSGYSDGVISASGTPRETQALTFSRIGVNFTATPGEFSFLNFAQNATSKVFSGVQQVKWFINNSGSVMTYSAPNGAASSVAQGKSDVWVGESLIFSPNAPPATYGLEGGMQNFKFSFENGLGTIILDNISITASATSKVNSTKASSSNTNVTGLASSEKAPVVNNIVPLKVLAIPLSNSVLLQWTAVDAAKDYIIEYKKKSESKWTTFQDGISVKQGLTITGLNNKTEYAFRVLAVNTSSSVGAPSAIVTAIPKSNLVSLNYNNHILSTGQSLSIGTLGAPALTKTQPYDNKMLDATATALIPLIEPTTNGLNNCESMSSAMANTISALALGYNSIVSLNGVSGVAYSVLKKGTPAYKKGLDRISAGLKMSIEDNKPYKVAAITVVHGESDQKNGRTAAEYESYLKQWMTDYQTDIQAITGQSDVIPLFTDQNSSWGNYTVATPEVPLGQLNASINNPGKIILVTPKYMLDYYDNVHLKNYSYRRLGEYYGKVMKKVLVDKQPWIPLSPKTVTISGNIIKVKFNVPVGPLAFDTTAVIKAANYGFEYSDDSNSTTLTGNLSDIVIIAPDEIQLKLINAPAVGSNPKLRYAYTAVKGVKAGRDIVGSPKGNLRDSDQTPSTYQDSRFPATMGNFLRNWCITFDVPILTN